VLVDAILLLNEVMRKELVDGQVVIEYCLADGVFLDVLDVLPE
jgi:hypothetical protein